MAISILNIEVHGPLNSCGPRSGAPAAPPLVGPDCSSSDKNPTYAGYTNPTQYQIGVERTPVRRAVLLFTFVNKRINALHASVATDICLTSRLVRATSCALFALFPYGEKFVVFG